MFLAAELSHGSIETDLLYAEGVLTKAQGCEAWRATLGSSVHIFTTL